MAAKLLAIVLGVISLFAAVHLGAVDNGGATASAATVETSISAAIPSSSSSESSDDDAAGAGRFCPIVFDDSMTECQKIQAILSILDPSKTGEDFCERAGAWLEQLQVCCTTKQGKPDDYCFHNAELVFDPRNIPLLQFGDAQ